MASFLQSHAIVVVSSIMSSIIAALEIILIGFGFILYIFNDVLDYSVQGRCKPSAENSLYAEVQPVLAVLSPKSAAKVLTSCDIAAGNL